MPRQFEFSLYALLIIGAIAYGWIRAAPSDDEDMRGNPRRPRPIPEIDEGAAPLPKHGPVFEVIAERKTGSAVGTAYAMSKKGYWLTAAHVVRDCNALFIRAGKKPPVPAALIHVHPSYDLAVLGARLAGVPTFQLAQNPVKKGMWGFHMGYPGGRPGDAASTFMGSARLRTSGYVRRLEPIDVWAEKRRHPPALQSLGGISGGPAFNGAGKIVGSTIASTVRRGRIYTAPISSLQNALDRAGAKATEPKADGNAIGRFQLNRMTEIGNTLRASGAIAQVQCVVANS